MQVTATEVPQIKERFLPLMQDVEKRLENAEQSAESSTTEEQLGKLKERFRPVMQDIERRLLALESRPIESALSNVSFADDPVPTPMTTLIERIQVLECKSELCRTITFNIAVVHFVNSTRSSGGMRKGDGSISDLSSTHLLPQEQVFFARESKRQRHGYDLILEEFQLIR